MTRIISLAVVFTALLLTGLAGGCSTLPPQNGPIVGVRNDSDAPLRVRFWIGDRRQKAAGMPLELTADKVLEIRPYGTTQYRLGAFSGYESPSESFIRVQIEPIGPTFQASTQYWYEFNPPSPFVVRIYGAKPDLKFERSGPGTMAFVPPAYWFHATPVPTPAVTTTSTTRPATTSPAASTVRTSTTTTTATPRPTGTPTTTTTHVAGVSDTGMDSNR